MEAATQRTVSDLVLKMAKALVDRPEDVFVEALDAPPGLTMKLSVAPGDLGKVIGKQGRTARALRVILMAVGTKGNARICLDITCPLDSQSPQAQPPTN